MYLGIDIGGTKTLIACFNDQGTIQEQQRIRTPKNYTDFISEVARCVDTLTTKTFHYCCVAVPGRLDRGRGIGIVLGNLPWQNVSIQEDIQKIVGCPTRIENDANLAGLSEALLIPGYSRVLYITVSTGIGTGLIIDQTIDPYLADSEGGHMVLEHDGKQEAWEDFASGRAIVRKFGKRAEEITDARTWRIIAHDLALGIIDLIAMLQPQVIVFGGGVDKVFERFQPYLEAELKEIASPLTPIPPLRKAARPEEAVVYGCYAFARRQYASTH